MSASRALIFLLLLSFIAPTIASAGFVGPYSGKVLDSQTGEPIEGASVLIFWEENVISVPESHTNFIKAKLIYTDKNGEYIIPIDYLSLSLLGTLDYTIFCVYQPGYQIHRNSYSHGRSRLAQTFKERDNIVKLDRIPPDFSFKEHLQRIENALIGIDDYPYGYPREPLMTWGMMISDKMRGAVEKAEFLRRARWEERRNLEEWREKR